MRCCREKNSAVLELIRESTGIVAIEFLRRHRQEAVLRAGRCRFLTPKER
jgi:hypothetical protein